MKWRFYRWRYDRASVLHEAYFYDEEAAFAALEKIRWPNGPICPHCGAVGRQKRLEDLKDNPTGKNPDGAIQLGIWRCGRCRLQFTARKGTLFAGSWLKLHQWFRAIFLLRSTKKTISTGQLAQALGCTAKTARFVKQRMRNLTRYKAPASAARLANKDDNL